jgi:K+-sensing histidine kinase KdpD
MWFMYRCPRTRQTVRGDVADDLIGSGETYLPVTCTACGRIHFVNPKTGELVEANVEVGASMPLWKQTEPIAMSLGITLAVTAALFYYKDGHQHLVFFNFFPIAFVAVIYGSVLSMACAIFAALGAAFFLYDPIYSLYVSDPREVGELIVFAAIGLIGAKYVAKLTP